MSAIGHENQGTKYLLDLLQMNNIPLEHQIGQLAKELIVLVIGAKGLTSQTDGKISMWTKSFEYMFDECNVFVSDCYRRKGGRGEG